MNLPYTASCLIIIIYHSCSPLSPLEFALSKVNCLHLLKDRITPLYEGKMHRVFQGVIIAVFGIVKRNHEDMSESVLIEPTKTIS